MSGLNDNEAQGHGFHLPLIIVKYKDFKHSMINLHVKQN